MKKKDFALGILCGAMLFSGATAVATGITAEPTWQNIYVDGEQVSMTAYNIAGNNYVKLRDIGQQNMLLHGLMTRYIFLHTDWMSPKML